MLVKECNGGQRDLEEACGGECMKNEMEAKKTWRRHVEVNA